jgi:taurine dioxygenase
MMNIHPLSDACGAEIVGLDLTQPLDEETFDRIIAALYEHLVVCIRDQQLTPHQLADYAKRFGAPIVHVEKDILVQDVPEVMTLSNADGRPERQRNGGFHWHTDLVFTEDPTSFTMLNAVAVPRRGGETGFADQYAAYERLPAALREAIEGVVVAHCYEGRRDGSMPTVYHPLVREHPITGRKALYGASSTCIGIKDMPEDEAADLLDEVGRHALDPAVQYEHHYRVNDVVMWDNAALLHTGPRLDEAEDTADARIMNRVSVRGWPRLSH